MSDFRYSIFVTIVCLGLAALWGYHSSDGFSGIWPAVSIAAILGVMEVSLSFDNAVVNASILKEMDSKWRQIFLTIGILIAVFGMRLLFPILIVAIATGQSMFEVSQLALNQPEVYSNHLHASHTAIAAFGGTFLFMIFLSFLFDEGKELHWFPSAFSWLNLSNCCTNLLITIKSLMARKSAIPWIKFLHLHMAKR